MLKRIWINLRPEDGLFYFQASSQYSDILNPTRSYSLRSQQHIIGRRQQAERRFRREFAGLNGDSLDGGTKTTLR